MIKNILKIRGVAIITILILAFLLRVWNIDTNPPGVHADEADSGYNAYSILKTGKDFYGNFLPLQITGFAKNYRTPLSTYLTVPSVALFGMTPFSIRLPAVLLGTVFVGLMYLLTKKLFGNDNVSLIAALLTAFNPWSIHISRAYADHILALDLGVLGIILLMGRLSIVSAITAGTTLGLSLFSYHAPKLFLPLFLPTYFLFFKNEIWNQRRYFVLFAVTFSVFFLFMLKLSFFNSGASEFHNVSIFNTRLASDIVNKERRVTEAPLFVSSFFHNKPLFFAKELARNYGRFFSINYLYLDGEPNLTAWIGDRGLFYLIELPFLLVGIYFAFRRKTKIALFLVVFALIGALPGVITKDQMYTYRGIFLLPVMLSVTAFGVYSLIVKNAKRLVVALLIIVYVLSISSFLFHYYYDYPVYGRKWWAAEEHDAINYINANGNKYDNVFVDGGVDWMLLYAFYNRIDPVAFQDTLQKPVDINGIKFVRINNVFIGSVRPKDIDKPEEYFPKDSLYIGRVGHFPNTKPVFEVLSKEDWGTIYRMLEVK